jgi:hypothetical protein
VQSTAWSIVATVGAAALALIVVQLAHHVVLRLSRRSPLWFELARHAHRPAQLLAVLVAVQIAVRSGPATGGWEPALRHVIWLAVIGSVAGVVAALAAQSVLGNVFAGLQLAFSDAVRLDDVVVVEGEWGRVEELTLSYVVVQIWDDRRLILPTSYFTNNPFQNWTRSRAAVLGTVELDVDWSVPVPEMREELRSSLEGNPQWDGRVCVLQVTDATGPLLRLRALTSAADAPTLWDLRCQVREHLVSWVRHRYPYALPTVRTEIAYRGGQRPQDGRGASEGRGGPDGRSGPDDDDARVFSGSDDGEARASALTGPEERAGRR